MVNYQITTLKNGLTFIEAPIESSEATTIYILVKAGGRFENEKNNGISHFLEHMFFKGSKNYKTAFDVSSTFDSIGAGYNAFTSEEYTGFYVKSSSRDFQKAFDVLTDIFLNPLVDEEEFEREKGVITQEIKMHNDLPQSFVQIINQKQMFQDHPLGRNLAGEEEIIKALSRDDILKYCKTNYTPQNIIVVIAGKKDGNWKKSVEERFGSLSQLDTPQFIPYKKSEITGKIIHKLRPIDQAHFLLSFIAISKDDPRRYALNLLSSILGGASSSRLFMEIREKRGLAYHVESNYDLLHDTGLFSIYGGVKSDKVDECYKIIMDEINDLKTKGPTEEEILRAKGNLRGALALSLENSMSVASFMADDLMYLGKIRKFDEVIEKSDAVTKEEIIALANEIFNKDYMGLAIVSPVKSKIKL